MDYKDSTLAMWQTSTALSYVAKLCGVIVLSGSFALLACGANAQTVTPADAARTITDQAGPGRLDERFRERERYELKAPEARTVDPDSIVAELTDGPTFTLSRVTVSGNTAISDREIAKISAPYVNSVVSLSEVKAIAAKITALYRNKGYILSRAVVPPQRVGDDGAVQIQIIEGFVERVTFQQDGSVNQALLEQYAQQITRQRPLNNMLLERYLLLMDDLSGTEAQGVLSASETTVGASVLTVVLDHKKVDGQLFFNNRGSRFLGPLQGGVTVGLNSTLGMSERIQLRTIASANLEELRYYEAQYMQPVGAYGTSVSGAVSYSETQPGGNLEPLDVEGDSLSVSVDVTHPFIRSRSENLTVSGGLDYRNTTSDILSSEIFEDRIRTLNLSMRYDTFDQWQGINYVDAKITQGVELFDANDADDALSRANGKNRFTKINAGYSRQQHLYDKFSLFGSISGQYSFDALLASEEFAIGGQPFGSAYDPAEITGDSGVAARTELRYGDSMSASYLDAYQLYGFYDGGKVWNRELIAGESDHDSLTSTGAGARLYLPQNVRANVEVAVPLSRDVRAEGSDGDDVRGFFSLSYIF